MAEDAARELPNLPLEDALQLVHLYGERGSPKFEPAARRWLVRYLTEGTPGMKDIAKVTASLLDSYRRRDAVDQPDFEEHGLTGGRTISASAPTAHLAHTVSTVPDEDDQQDDDPDDADDVGRHSE